MVVRQHFVVVHAPVGFVYRIIAAKVTLENRLRTVNRKYLLNKVGRNSPKSLNRSDQRKKQGARSRPVLGNENKPRKQHPAETRCALNAALGTASSCQRLFPNKIPSTTVVPRALHCRSRLPPNNAAKPRKVRTPQRNHKNKPPYVHDLSTT